MNHWVGLIKIRTSLAQIRRWNELNAMENEKQDKESFEKTSGFEKILNGYSLGQTNEKKEKMKVH